MPLRIKEFAKTYPTHGPALRGADLTLEHGEVVALLGKSGAGKSTLLRGICGLEEMDAGEAWLDQWHYVSGGRRLAPGWQIARRLGMVFQSFNLFPNMPVWRNITLGPERVFGMKRTRALELATEVAGLLDIEDLLDKYPSQISGGQAQRVALARAVVLRPTVLVLDEVTSALDPITVDLMIDALRKIRTVEGAIGATHRSTLLLVTHAIRFAESFADRILFLEAGRIVENRPAKEFRTSNHPAVCEYLAHVA